MNFSEENARLFEALTPEEREHYQRCQELARETYVVEALNKKTGKRSRLEFTEHHWIGPGWMMTDLNDRDQIVSSFDLTDMVSAGVSPPVHGDFEQRFHPGFPA